jgi:uroporphyrinogen decarboxylase
MNHRDRVLTALGHEEPDRVPFSIRYTPEMEKKVLQHLGITTDRLSLHARDGGVLPLRMGHDLLFSMFGPCTSYYLKSDEEYIDEWGIRWRWVSYGGGRYTEIAEYPLAGLTDPGDFKLPDFESADRYDDCRKLVQNHGSEYAIIGGIPCTLFELAWYLRGMTRIMEDMLVNKDFLHAYLDKLLTWAMEAGAHLAAAGVDIVWIGDDFGSQDRMLISPELFREFFKPRYARLLSHLRSIKPDLKFAFHTDGYVYPIISDFVEIGIDILNPIQPGSMNPATLKKEYGDKLTFWGTVDNQEVMPFGTPEDVVAEVRLRLRTVAPRGGLIISPAHNLQPQTSIENVLAFHKTVEEFGRYPIRA